MEENAPLCQEWQTLQNNYESCERSALLIKLACLSLGLAGLAAGVAWGWLGGMVVLCWFQEGILKTFQARLGERLLRIEALVRQPPIPPGVALQLHSEFLAARPGGAALIAAYAASAARPTVAYPYLPILLLGGAVKALGGA